MTEDVKPEVIKGTQDVLGKFIKKPVLTEKLLKKPPFRFLHDICTSIMKETGFFSGVLNSPEYMLENIKDKEGKIAFLQKVIATVEAINGVKLTVKPNKVVAGLEPGKTNEFLQALGKAVKKQQLENKNAKAQHLKTKTPRSHSKEVKEKHQEKKHPSNKTSKTIVENGVHESNNDNKKKQSETVAAVSPKKKHTSKKNEEIFTKVEKNVEKKSKEKILEKESQNDALHEKKNEKNAMEQTIVNEAGESVDLLNKDSFTINTTNGKGDQNNEVVEVVQDKDLKRNQTDKQKHRRSSIYSSDEHMKLSGISNESNKNESPVKSKENITAKSESVAQSQSRTSPTSPPEQLNYPKKDKNLVREKTLISRPRTGIRSSTARPASARPAAPRIRERSEVTVVEETVKPTSGKVNVIVDRDVNNETEDDHLISLETNNDILLEEVSIPPDPVSTLQEGEHGHLVEQILEAQKELEKDGRLSLAEEKVAGKTEIKWEFDKTAESAAREIEKLRSNIQTLTRSANPLGKLFDYFQEDVESIQRELESWKNKNSSYCLQIAHEKSITEQFVEPLKIHLKEIQRSIDRQFEQISLVKANIIRNNQKIQKLLAGSNCNRIVDCIV